MYLGMAIASRMGTFWLPYNFFAELFAAVAPFLPDWKTHNKNRFKVDGSSKKAK